MMYVCIIHRPTPSIILYSFYNYMLCLYIHILCYTRMITFLILYVVAKHLSMRLVIADYLKAGIICGD